VEIAPPPPPPLAHPHPPHPLSNRIPDTSIVTENHILQANMILIRWNFLLGGIPVNYDEILGILTLLITDQPQKMWYHQSKHEHSNKLQLERIRHQHFISFSERKSNNFYLYPAGKVKPQEAIHIMENKNSCFFLQLSYHRCVIVLPVTVCTILEINFSTFRMSQWYYNVDTREVSKDDISLFALITRVVRYSGHTLSTKL
jgi:hypothetical protein